MRGYTLIELLIVMLIMSIIGVTGYVNYKDYAIRKETEKALGQIQTILRLAQTNATTSTVCNGLGGASWSVQFETDQKTITLVCGPANSSQKTYSLENVKISSIAGSGCQEIGFSSPVIITYSSGQGALTISPSENCLQNASTIRFTVENTKDSNVTKVFNLSKGGAVNAQ
ncbi:MAG: Uncharacterized protein G01um10147_604 [Microgenomates group bacterium Gr01-1014_7]|nr:MAG: Uncharacterized protein G01um10147_604 [Microgenomates group bacterium Gr01-1014_7]